jgi:hypothetical protein
MHFRPARALAALCLVAACGAAGSVAGEARFLGAADWRIEAEWFGGLSGIEIADDGLRVVALSDRGYLLKARLTRDGDRITGIEAVTRTVLTGPGGAALIFPATDSEGLARAPDGSFFISFEQTHEVRHYTAAGQYLGTVPPPRGAERIEANKSFEALALAPDGTLYTMPESQLVMGHGFPVVALRNGEWRRAFDLPQRGGFRAVGADFGPDGAFYLLERKVGLLGFETRVRRFDITGDAPTGETVILHSEPSQFGNVEGLSVWRDAAGRTRLTMISDDNFWAFLSTQIVEYVLTE